MPDKPLWLNRVPDAIRQLENSADVWIDRPALETMLAIGRRRAQQLLQPIARRRVGTSLLAHRDDVIAQLELLAAGERAYYEERRRKQLWAHLEQVRREWLQQPPVLVEVPHAQMRRLVTRDFDGLPQGVELSPGSITIRFAAPHEALQKLMALAVAISHNQPAFEDLVTPPGI